MKAWMFLLIWGLGILLILITDISVLELVGIGLVIYVGYDMIAGAPDALPIGHIALLMGGLQWIVSPIIAYHSSNLIYPMAVIEHEYLTKTLILYIPLYLAILWTMRRYATGISDEQLSEFCCCHMRGIKLITAIGFLAWIVPISSPSLSFILTLTRGLFYTGTIMLCFAYPSRAVVICLCFALLLLIRSILGGAFHDLMIWGIFMVTTIFYIKKYSARRRLAIIAVLLVCVSTIQAIKPIYRNMTWWGNYQGNKIELFANLFTKSLIGELDTSGDNVDLNGRLNQGWIISRIYKNIPDNQPYLGGKTIWEGIEATLIPRFLAPNKKGAGKESIQDFETFTGYSVNSSTSMGLSILGEAYGNFGLFFGAVFMLIWGWCISQLILWLHRRSERNGYFYFFLPLICFDLIKAEINFVSVINWTVKALVFSFIVIYLIHHFIQEDVIDIFPSEKGVGQ